MQTFPAAAVGSGLFNHPAVLTRPSQRLPLYGITWDDESSGNTSEVSFPVAYATDFSASALSLLVAVDATNTELNPPGLDQTMTVILTDSHGNEVAVDIPAGTPALSSHPGTFVEREGFVGTMQIWEGYTPLGELRIPMHKFVSAQLANGFTEFDLESITEIALQFTPGTAGAIMLQNAYLIPIAD